MRLVLGFLLLCFFTRIHSQVSHKSISELGNHIDHYMAQNQPDSAYICISKFLDRKNIDTVELFYGHLFFGQTYFQTKKINPGFQEMRKCAELIHSRAAYAKCRVKLYLVLSEEYFTLQQFDSAHFYATASLFMSQHVKPDNNQYNLARCYNILGYCSYLKKQYPQAIIEFEKSIENYKAIGDFCELPLVYCKIARVYNSLGEKVKAEKLINDATHISDTCHIKENALICKYAHLDIYKENHDYEKALACLEDINRMVEMMDKERQLDKIDKLEVQYNTKLKDYENNSLKKVNLRIKEVMSKQRLELIISIIAIAVMFILSFLVIRISRYRKSTLREIEIKTQEIENQNKELERLHVLNQKIFSVISHDFRGPMLSLQLLLDTFDKEPENTELNRYIMDVSNQLMYANQILDNLLNWARTEIHININDISTTYPYSIANEIITQFNPAAEKKHISIVNEIPGMLTLQIPPDVMRIVFRNLISNAIKYSFEDSVVNIYYDSSQQTIIVQDHGIGINENKLNSLFSKDMETSLGTWQEAGFGIGLYITHELLHRFGGQIKARGHKYGGTEFAVYIPQEKK